MPNSQEIKDLTELITAFRSLTARGAISPESLGYLLQRIVDDCAVELANVAYLSDVDTQFKRFRDAVRARLANISVTVTDGKLVLSGHEELVKLGYVPYVFRHIKKRSQFRDKYRPGLWETHHCPKYKGWTAMGCYAFCKLKGSNILFADTPHSDIGNIAALADADYISDPSLLVNFLHNDSTTNALAWGRSIIHLDDTRTGNFRMARMRFAIGFAPRFEPGRRRLRTSDLVSSLAEFSVIYDPNTRLFSFGKI